jgi:hemolysin activation/secretion protein
MLSFDAADNIREDEQLTSGGSEILRGYPSNSQRGDRRWLMTVERRHFTDWHLYNLLRVGGAVYIDAGRTWDSRLPSNQHGETLANAGVGLRFSSSKSRVDRVLHIDYAIPLTARKNIADHQVVIVGKVEF